MLYIIRKVLASLEEFSGIDNVIATRITQQLMVFVTKRLVASIQWLFPNANTAVNTVWLKAKKTFFDFLTRLRKALS